MLYEVKGKGKRRWFLSLFESDLRCTDDHLLGFKPVTCLVRYWRIMNMARLCSIRFDEWK